MSISSNFLLTLLHSKSHAILFYFCLAWFNISVRFFLHFNQADAAIFAQYYGYQSVPVIATQRKKRVSRKSDAASALPDLLHLLTLFDGSDAVERGTLCCFNLALMHSLCQQLGDKNSS